MSCADGMTTLNDLSLIARLASNLESGWLFSPHVVNISKLDVYCRCQSIEWCHGLASNLIVSSIESGNELVQRSSHHIHLTPLLLYQLP